MSASAEALPIDKLLAAFQADIATTGRVNPVDAQQLANLGAGDQLTAILRANGVTPAM